MRSSFSLLRQCFDWEGVRFDRDGSVRLKTNTMYAMNCVWEKRPLVTSMEVIALLRGATLWPSKEDLKRRNPLSRLAERAQSACTSGKCSRSNSTPQEHLSSARTVSFGPSFPRTCNNERAESWLRSALSVRLAPWVGRAGYCFLAANSLTNSSSESCRLTR